MSENAALRASKDQGAPGGNDPGSVLNALAEPVLALDRDDAITYVNSAAEQLFGASA